MQRFPPPHHPIFIFLRHMIIKVCFPVEKGTKIKSNLFQSSIMNVITAFFSSSSSLTFCSPSFPLLPLLFLFLHKSQVLMAASSLVFLDWDKTAELAVKYSSIWPEKWVLEINKQWCQDLGTWSGLATSYLWGLLDQEGRHALLLQVFSHGGQHPDCHLHKNLHLIFLSPDRWWHRRWHEAGLVTWRRPR